MITGERKRRRKIRFPDEFYLGHTVKSRMTVIIVMESYQNYKLLPENRHCINAVNCYLVQE